MRISLSKGSSGLMHASLFSAALALVVLLAPAPRAQAQISVQIGPAPACPYGYFSYPPYNCAPWGYYGPEWFNGGIFVGAGPWFHGPREWHGHVNRFYDPRRGYHGALPHRGEHDAWENGHWRGHPHEQFRGNETRDGHDHVVREGGHHPHN
jgi:hypothetical protein